MTSEELISLDAEMELFLKKNYNKGLLFFFKFNNLYTAVS